MTTCAVFENNLREVILISLYNSLNAAGSGLVLV